MGFMLAESMASAEEIARYFHTKLYAEFKYDGVRAQAHKVGTDVKLYSRRLEDVSADFPEVIEDLARVNHDFILDGEVLPFKDGRPLPFQALQRRLHRKMVDAELKQACPVSYLVYDVLWLDGTAVIDKPLFERRRLLEGLGLSGAASPSPLHEVRTADEIQALFDKSRTLGYEGLVLKVLNAPYQLGRRGKLWVKLKRELDTLDVVIVAAEYGHGKRANVISDYTFAVRNGDRLRVIGKAYTGLTDDEIVWMTKRLKELTIEERGNKMLVKPEIVLEVAFDRIQRSDRHERGGFALRFPRIKRIRHDKGPADIDTMGRVREIYSRQEGVG
jgi:DNA ligase-1